MNGADTAARAQQPPGSAERRPADVSLSRPADEGFVLEDYIYYNINHASNQYGHHMEAAFALLDIDQTAWRVLNLLSHDEHSRLSDIARRGMVKISTLSRRIDRMVEDGLILREVGTDDRRTVRVSLTSRGKAELERARRASTAIYDQATTGIAPDDLRVAVSVLQKMRTNLEGNDAP